MARTRHFILIPLIFIFITGCEESTPTAPLEIRIQNVSSADFHNVIVNTGDGEKNFGPIESLRRTSYQPFEFAYSYAYVELFINGKPYVIQPFDFVGEKPLADGRYTYQVSIDKESGQLSMKLVKD